jgi:SAM-dependent methyltransferase
MGKKSSLSGSGKPKKGHLKKEQSHWTARYSGEPFPWGREKSGLAGVAEQKFSEHSHRKVLDVGCGSGRDAIHFRKNGLHVVGIDPCAKAIEIAKKWAKKEGTPIRFLRQDFLRTRIKNSSFGGIFCYNTFQVFNREQQARAVKKMAEILKPKGIVVLSVFSEKEKVAGRSPVQRFKRTQLQKLFEPHFDILELKRMDFPEEHSGSKHVHHEWLLVARKK